MEEADTKLGGGKVSTYARGRMAAKSNAANTDHTLIGNGTYGTYLFNYLFGTCHIRRSVHADVARDALP